MLYPKPCYNEMCYKEVEAYVLKYLLIKRAWSDCVNAQCPVWFRPLLPVYDIRVLFLVLHIKWEAASENLPTEMCAQWRLKSAYTLMQSDQSSLSIQNAPSDDSDQTAQMHRLNWIFPGCTCQGMLSDTAAQMLLLFLWFSFYMFD